MSTKTKVLKLNPVEHQQVQESMQKFDHLVLPFGVCYLENFELILSGSPVIPIHLILLMSPTCHTLSKAFEISKKLF